MEARKTLYLILGMTTISVLLVLVGCSSDQPTLAPTATEMPAATATPTSVPALASSLQRISSPDVAAGDLRELAAGNNAFALDLYQALRGGEGNLLFSPYSISQALAMTYAGARGETEQQMAGTLHFTLPQEHLHPAFNALDLALASRSHASIRDESGETVEEVAFQLNIANAAWGQQGCPFLPEYLDLLALNYGAGVRLVDFGGNPAAAVDAINRWVSEETEGRIRNIVEELEEDTGLVLANAIYFNAKWDRPFDEDRTHDETFHLLDGGEEQIPVMHRTADYRYTEGDGYQAIQLLYLNREVAMVVVLPREGRFREIEERLTGEWVQDVVGGFHEHEVILSMPKFRLEPPPFSLKETLSAMGMPGAFLRGADFFGIIERQPGLAIYIGEVLHQACIDVNEQRTEAAAAVVVEVVVEVQVSTPPPPIVMKIDRPFIFFIRDIETGAILFVGRVMNPASE
jgi:serpin B